MRTSLKTTTAVLACLNLAIPSQSFAQAEPGAEGSESVCVTDPTSQACRDLIAQETGGEDESQAGGAETESAPETDSAPEPAAEPEAAPEGEAGGAADADMSGAEGGSAGASEEAAPAAGDDASADMPADAIPDEAVAGDEEAPGNGAEEVPAPEAPASDPAIAPETSSGSGEDPAASDEEAQPSEVETGEQPEAQSGAQQDAPSPAQDDTQSAPADEAPTAPEDMPGSDAAPSATQDDAADAEPDEAQGSETEAAPEEETPPAPQQAAPGGGASPEAQPQSDAQGNGEPSPDAQSQTDEGAQTPEDDGARPQADESAPARADDGAETGGQAQTEDTQSDMPGDEGPQESAEPAAPRNESSQDPAQAPAQSSEAPAGQGDAGLSALEAGDATDAEDVTTETVTEESARSSSEDFTSGIDQSPEAEDEGGLSDLERALVLGAGALAVGAIMRGGREVVASSDDRVVVSGSDGGYQLIKDDDALLRQPGSEVRTQTFDDGSTRTVVMREDGSQIVTIRDAELRVVRRARITPDGQEILLIDDTETSTPVDTSALTASAETRTYAPSMDEDALRAALSAQQGFDRSYSLSQIRSTEQVRAQVPAIDLETITFASGSAAISPAQADELTQLGQFIADRVEENPREIFLVEGHTDAVGDAAYNLALSDRRAESVALALTEYFNVPPENLVVQGYGEQFLKVQTEAAEQANRRATLRQITPLLQVAAAGR